MQIERRVSVHFDMNIPQDAENYTAFQNLQKTFNAITEFKKFIDSEIDSKDKPKPTESYRVSMENIKSKYIEILANNGVKFE